MTELERHTVELRLLELLEELRQLLIEVHPRSSEVSASLVSLYGARQSRLST